jgi:fatty-acyl-CoA synthase
MAEKDEEILLETPLLLESTIGELLDRNAKKYPSQDAVVFVEKNLRYTWSELKEICDKAAKGFLQLGIKKGDHIAIWGTNVPEWLITQFAAAKIGAPLVTMNPEWKLEEVEYALKQSDTHTLILIEGFTKQTSKGVEEYKYLDIIQQICVELANSRQGELKSKTLPKLKNVVLISALPHPGIFLWKDVLKMGSGHTSNLLEYRQNSVTYKDTAILQSTSGTTGNPKCAMLTHYNVVNNAMHSAKNIRLTRKDILCSPVAPDHIFGSVLANLCCLATGAAIVMPSAIFNPEKTLKAAQEEKCTAIHGVPRMFGLELEVPDFNKFDLSSLEKGIIAGSRCFPELMTDIIQKMHVQKISIVWGQTEASPTITQVRYDDSTDLRTSTVGRAIEGVEVKIINPETEQEIPVGETGEAWARGYNVMSEYYNDPEKTAETITADGWLKTGDLLKKLPNGYFEFVERLKNMIVVSGQNVYPAEIEKCLLKNPRVSDIIVVGVPSKKKGGDEEVCACIIVKPNCSLAKQEVKDWVKERKAYYNIPKYVEFVDNLPTTSSGKLSANKLKKIMIEKLGLEN